MEISCCFIVKNEELTLARVLTCAQKFADEIVVVDTGSQDKSKEIARQFTDLVYDFAWIDDFSKARNFAFDKATKPYLMWLDADDYISDEEIAKIIEFKNQSNINFNVAFMNYAIAFDESNKPTFCYKRERIVKNLPELRFVDPIHECIVPRGKTIDLNITIEHRKEKASDSQRNLKIYKNLIDKGAKFSSRMKFYYANELYYTKNYLEAVNEYEAYLRMPAYVENKIQACLNLSCCYYALGNTQLAEQTLYRSFEYDIPRAEILCQLSLYLINEGKINNAIYWLKQCIRKPDISSGAFVLLDCYDFIPYYNLATCEYKLGHIKRALSYAQKALALKPQNQEAQAKVDYFSNLLNNH